ncbi:hypothetical protein [Pseudomonas paeninsulae]|uniref:hypothetical protein n=1 Tax=Pseudomonas paeninsulae TaxID=3110772 RepID=UPI002D796603|nr:hypothetical protein [Pseudomonas sp. IT1137]
MHKYRFELILAALLLAVFVAFGQWHAPGSKLSADEIEGYMSTLERDLAWPEEEKGEILRHLHAWAEADDGKPVYMLNLMRYYPQLRPLPQVAGFKGTPEQANAYYEEHVMPLLFARGAYPLFASTMQGVLGGEQPSTNLITFEPAIDNWSSVLVIRYPNRRAFLDLVSDPEYLKYMPYKAASLLVGLTPMKGDLILPMLSWALGAGLMLLFLAVAWIRALRRAR